MLGFEPVEKDRCRSAELSASKNKKRMRKEVSGGKIKLEAVMSIKMQTIEMLHKLGVNRSKIK